MLDDIVFEVKIYTTILGFYELQLKLCNFGFTNAFSI